MSELGEALSLREGRGGTAADATREYREVPLHAHPPHVGIGVIPFRRPTTGHGHAGDLGSWGGGRNKKRMRGYIPMSLEYSLYFEC